MRYSLRATGAVTGPGQATSLARLPIAALDDKWCRRARPYRMEYHWGGSPCTAQDRFATSATNDPLARHGRIDV